MGAGDSCVNCLAWLANPTNVSYYFRFLNSSFKITMRKSKDVSEVASCTKFLRCRLPEGT